MKRLNLNQIPNPYKLVRSGSLEIWEIWKGHNPYNPLPLKDKQLLLYIIINFFFLSFFLFGKDRKKRKRRKRKRKEEAIEGNGTSSSSLNSSFPGYN